MKITIPSRASNPAPSSSKDSGSQQQVPPSTSASAGPTTTTTIKIKPPLHSGAPAPAQNGADDRERAYADGIKLFQSLKDTKKDARNIAHEFQHLPPRNVFPDYYEIVKRPVSFAEIKTRLDRREYTSLRAVADDFHQMFINAKRYNVKGSNIFNDARSLDKLTKTVYARLTGTVPDTAGDADSGPEDTSMSVSPAPPAKQTSATPGPANNPNSAPANARSRTTTSQTPSTAAAPSTSSSGPPPKKKQKKDSAPEKPITLTKWLSTKVDDLVATTDQAGRSLADIFINLPKRELYPDYYALIQRPVSFQLVRSRLKNRNYPTIASFVSDVNAIFNNAQFYNEEGSQIYTDADVLRKRFEELMQETPPEFFVRPRNQNQQQTSADVMRERAALETNRTSSSRNSFASPSAETNARTMTPGLATGANHLATGADVQAEVASPGTGTVISYDLGGADGIENIAFKDEFDEEEDAAASPAGDDSMTVDDSEPVKLEDDTSVAPHLKAYPGDIAVPAAPAVSASPISASASASPAPAPASDLTAVGSGGPLPLQTKSANRKLSKTEKEEQQRLKLAKMRRVATLSISEPPLLSGFEVAFYRNTVQDSFVGISNDTVKQHSLICPRVVDRVDVLPILSPASTSSQQQQAEAISEIVLSARGGVGGSGLNSSNAGTSMAQTTLSTEEREQKKAWTTRWSVKLGSGLTVLELIVRPGVASTTAGQEGKEQVYRLFINQGSSV